MKNYSIKVLFSKISKQKECRQIVHHLYKEYQKIQDKLCLKNPYCAHFKLAKISKIIVDILDDDYLTVEYYYDGLNGEHVKIIKAEDGKEGFSNAFELQCQDVINAKQVLQCLIETFHWSANFGQFIDPLKENLIYNKEEDFFLFIPTFTLITQYIFFEKFEFSFNKFIKYRQTAYQHLTHIFFCDFLDQFSQFLKEQDEDKLFYKQRLYDHRKNVNDIRDTFNLMEDIVGVDSLYSEDLVQKKSWRYSFKQSMILYQLDSNKKLRDLFLEKKKEDQQLSLNPKQISSTAQSENLLNFLRQLTDIKSESHDVLTSFAQKIKLYLVTKEDNTQNINKVAAIFRPNYKPIQNCCRMIDVQLQQKQGQQQDKQKIDCNPNNGLFDFTWQSDIDSLNIISQFIQSQPVKNGGDPQSSMKQGVNGKQLLIRYKFELLEQKNCYIVRTVIPEILYTIETADDIMFLVNVLQKEQGQTNLYVDDNRRLMLYSSIVLGQKIEILSAIIKIIDIHQIYCYLLIEFYVKNISLGRCVKEMKYQHFIRELLHYVQDYENDFEIQMKNIASSDVQIGF